MSMSTTAANGQAYGHLSAVAVDPAKLIGEFTGRVVISDAFAGRPRTEQGRYATDTYYSNGIVRVIFEQMVFDPAVLDLLRSITKNASDTLNDGSTAATSRTYTSASKPQPIQVLFHMTKTGSGNKQLEIEALKAYCTSLSVVMPKTQLAVHNCVWDLMADGSGNVVKISEEN